MRWRLGPTSRASRSKFGVLPPIPYVLRLELLQLSRLWDRHPGVGDGSARAPSPSVEEAISKRMTESDSAPFKSIEPDPWPKVREPGGVTAPMYRAAPGRGMSMTMHRALIVAAALIVACDQMPPASARDWPTRPVRILIGFGAGGGPMSQLALSPTDYRSCLGSNSLLRIERAPGYHCRRHCRQGAR